MPTPTASRLPSLTGLRWIGAMLVFGYHVGTLGIMADPTHKAVIAKLFTLGLSGVQFFFILSGFVLTWSARTDTPRRTFWRRRFAKVFPNHAVMWVAVMLLYSLWDLQIDPGAVVANLFLVQAWSLEPDWYYSVNNVSWSLSCEMFFYLCLPLALPYVRRMPVWALWTVGAAMPLLILAVSPARDLVPEQHYWWFAQVFPVVRSLEFWLGVAAAELLRRGRWRGPGLPLSLGLFVAAWVAAGEWIPVQYWTTTLAVVYVLVIAATARSDVRGDWSPWRNRVLMWLGEVSFAYYLVHVFLIVAIMRALDRTGGFPGWQGPIAAVALLFVSLGCSWLLFRYVETPMMRRLGPARRPPGGDPPNPVAPLAPAGHAGAHD